MIKPKRLRQAGQGACIGGERNACSVLLEKPNGKNPPEYT
jgi:hypothetical protein